MYTIKEAAARTGIPIALLRAWERRYAIVEPVRTAGGYRVYDEAALGRLRSMRRLVDDGWSPSLAAAAILRGDPEATSTADASPMRPVTPGTPPGESAGSLVRAFVAAAAGLDPVAIEQSLDAIFAAGTFESIADGVLLPALEGLGEAWVAGDVGVAGEHAASHAVLRRLAAAFQAAGRPLPPDGSVLVGLPPGSRHELGALAFSVAARRAGLPIVYLGPDLPADDWVSTARRVHPVAAVIGSPTEPDVAPAIAVARAIRAADSAVVIAFGGRHAAAAAAGLPRTAPAIVLSNGIVASVNALRAAIPARSGVAAGTD